MAFDFKKIINFFKDNDEDKTPKEVVKEKEHEHRRHKTTNILLMITTFVIVVTFTLAYGTMEGITEFKANILKEKIKNKDGSISIPSEAQTRENSGRRKNASDLYVGKVLGQKIQLYKDDDFNYKIAGLLKNTNMNIYQQYQYSRYYFDMEINKIIGINNAKKMDIILSRDYLTKEIGKRYYTDNNGEVNYELMRKDVERVNKAKEQLIEQLLFENFNKDYFYGLPVSQEEVLDSYKLDNIKVTVDYIDISNADISKEAIKSFYDNNKDSYKKYQLTRLVFVKKDDGLSNLSKFTSEPAKFKENAEKLKSENKLNISYDSEAKFIDEMEDQELKDALKNATEGQILNKVIKTKIGYIIAKVDKAITADIQDQTTIEKVKKDYLEKNKDQVNNANKAKADEIFKYAKEFGFNAVKQKFGVEVKTTQPMDFGGQGLPNISAQKQEDLNLFAKIYKSNKQDIVEPYNYGSGYLIVKLTDKTQYKDDTFRAMYNDLAKKYSDEKSRQIENDYYTSVRKNMEVIDNFNYVFTYEMFMPKQDK